MPDIEQSGDDWPRDLRRCTCGTRSLDAEDHANGCSLGLAPPNASAAYPHQWSAP